jgi:carbonic anhydrase
MWSATEFHWHTQSEHTVEGKRYDLELQVMHDPVYKIGKDNNGFNFAGLAIFFDSSPEHRSKY